jgi:cytochrome P450
MAPISAANVLFVSIFESVFAFYFFSYRQPINTLTKTFFAFLALNSTIFLVYKLVIYPFFLSPFRHLPVPSKGFIPVLGHGLKMFQRPPGSAQLEFIKTVPNEGIINFQQFFHQDRLLLTKPSTLAEVLVHKSYDYEKPPWVRLFLEQYLGHGLLMTEGEEHKHQRKQIMPAFSFRHIKELYPLFWGKALELCDAMTADLWDKSEKVLDMTHYSTQVTLDIIGLAGLGRDICSLRNSDDELIETYEEILEPSAEKGIYFVLHLLFPQWLIHALPWGLNKRVKITAANLKRICTDFVEDKKARMKLEGQESVDILSIMMRSNNFSDQGLVDQLLTFLAAGWVLIS